MKTESTNLRDRQRQGKNGGRPLDPASERRWLAYALAAGAGLAMTTPSAWAEIVYTPPRPYNLIAGAYLPIDFIHEGSSEFSVRCSYSSLFGFGSLNLYRGEKFSGQASVIGGFNGAQALASALPAGAPIGPGRNFVNLSGRFARMEFNHTQTSGFWGNVQHRYLGLRFTVSRNTYYGWAEFSVRLSARDHLYWVVAKPEGYAYETVPNQPIAAGAGVPAHDASMPQPATLGLLAMGAQGMLFWRETEVPDLRNPRRSLL